VIDPITLEVLREAFVSIVREMRVTLVRTAYSSVLYEGEDFWLVSEKCRTCKLSIL
jgi:N-methylhydantoinase B